MQLLTTPHSPSYHLPAISLEKTWPVLSMECLAWHELNSDEHFSSIPQAEVLTYIQRSIQFGEKVAQTHAKNDNLQQLINRLLKEKVRIQIKSSHPTGASIRAQYSRKPPTITIYQPSIQQMKRFFIQMYEPVSEEELIRLHLYHEWFHHLEETKCGYTYATLPKVIVKRWGPVILQKSIIRTREIAAHAFTAKALDLKWSPLLLDHLLSYQEQGWSKTRIREHFRDIRGQYESLLQSTVATEEESKDQDEHTDSE